VRAIGLLRLVNAHFSMLSRKVSRNDVSQTVVYLVMWRRTAFYFGDTRLTSDAALVFLSLGWGDSIPGFYGCMWLRCTCLLCLIVVGVEE
jgi:hypothetical protein